MKYVIYTHIDKQQWIYLFNSRILLTLSHFSKMGIICLPHRPYEVVHIKNDKNFPIRIPLTKFLFPPHKSLKPSNYCYLNWDIKITKKVIKKKNPHIFTRIGISWTFSFFSLKFWKSHQWWEMSSYWHGHKSHPWDLVLNWAPDAWTEPWPNSDEYQSLVKTHY